MAESGPLIDEAFLRSHFLRIYLNDAVAQMLTKRQEGNTGSTMRAAKFFKQYFASVHQGTHVLFREYSFVKATPYNRLCALKAIIQIYKPLICSNVRYSDKDYHSLLKLVFPDFRLRVVQRAFRKYDNEKKDEENRLNFIDFLKALKVSFCVGDLDYEARLISDQIEVKIEEFSKLPPQEGDAPEKKPINVRQADFFWNVDDDTSARLSVVRNRILDGSELASILTIRDSSSDSGNEPTSCDEPLSGEKLKSKVSKSKKKGNAPKKPSTSKVKKGKPAGKPLSNNPSLLQSASKAVTEEKKPKARPRSKSLVSEQKIILKKADTEGKKPISRPRSKSIAVQRKPWR